MRLTVAFRSRFARIGRTGWGFLAGLIILALSVLACTANDTLFIQLTATPSPTVTSTPLSIETKFKIGETAVIYGFLSTMQTIPGLPRPLSTGSVGKASCTNSAKTPILDVSKNTGDANDPSIYYKVSCSGVTGWLPETYLSRFAAGDKGVVKSVSGNGADMFASPNIVKTTSGTCPDDTNITVTQLGSNQQDNKDRNIYLKVTCGTLTGFLRESDLTKPAK